MYLEVTEGETLYKYIERFKRGQEVATKLLEKLSEQEVHKNLRPSNFVKFIGLTEQEARDLHFCAYYYANIEYNGPVELVTDYEYNDSSWTGASLSYQAGSGPTECAFFLKAKIIYTAIKDKRTWEYNIKVNDEYGEEGK